MNEEIMGRAKYVLGILSTLENNARVKAGDTALEYVTAPVKDEATRMKAVQLVEKIELYHMMSNKIHMTMNNHEDPTQELDNAVNTLNEDRDTVSVLMMMG